MVVSTAVAAAAAAVNVVAAVMMRALALRAVVVVVVVVMMAMMVLLPVVPVVVAARRGAATAIVGPRSAGPAAVAIIGIAVGVVVVTALGLVPGAVDPLGALHVAKGLPQVTLDFIQGGSKIPEPAAGCALDTARDAAVGIGVEEPPTARWVSVRCRCVLHHRLELDHKVHVSIGMIRVEEWRP
jgi:hypothetical protein